MSIASVLRRSTALAMVLAGWGMLVAQITDEERERAEGVFKYVYGKAYDKAVVGTAKAKVEYAKVLAESAEKIDSDATLKLMVRDKAIALAVAAPSGYRLAADQYLAAMSGPEDKPSRIIGYVQLLEKMMPLEPAPTKQKLILDMMGAYRDAAAVALKKEGGNPQPFFEKAKKLGKQYALNTRPETKDLVRDIDRLEKDAEKQVATGKEMARLRAANERKPEDPAAAAALAALLIRDGRLADATVPLKKVPEGPIRKLGEVLADPKAGDAARAEAYRAAAEAAKSEARYFLDRSLGHQQAFCDAAAPESMTAALKVQQEILDKLLALEQGPGRQKYLEDQIVLFGDLAECNERGGKYAESLSHLEKARQTAKVGFKPAEQKELLTVLDGVGKELERRAGLAKQYDALAEKLKAAAGDAALNQAAGLLLLQLDRMPQAAAHLLKSDSMELRRVGEVLHDNRSPLERGNALHEAATEKTPFLDGLARREFEAALRADPKLPGGDKIKLLLAQSPAAPLSVALEIRKPLTRRVLVLFDEETPTFLAFPGKGEGRIGVEKGDAYSGKMFLKVTPTSYFFNQEASFKIPVRENPGKGEYRFLRFAWRKTGGAKLNLDLHVPRTGMPGWFRMSADAATGMAGDIQTLLVSNEVPKSWEVVTVDLFKELGACEVGGISFTPTDGEYASFDFLLMAPSLAELERYKRKPAK